MFRGSMERDGFLTQQGADELCKTLVTRLTNRLQIEDYYRTHPELAQQETVKPLFITGLPRTGTTAFANILSNEPAFRCMRVWEQEPAVPPPVLGEEENDPRRLGMKRYLEQNPEAMTMHLHELDAATEDPMLIGLEFKSQNATAPIFSYHAWWRECDMKPAYAYQRKVVKLLQSKRPPNRWLFKAPHYAFHLEDVISAYPDAQFVITHRDPVKTIPSWASLVSTLWPTGSLELFGRDNLGQVLANHQAIGMKKMIEARERLGPDRFLDVHQRDFAADPLREMERVYDFIGLELTDATRRQMLQWSEDNKVGTFGAHKYTAEEFGLSKEGLRKQFQFYTDHYNVL